jgi:hypothetical protein
MHPQPAVPIQRRPRIVLWIALLFPNLIAELAAWIAAPLRINGG